MTDSIGIVVILILIVFGAIGAFWLNSISDQLERIERYIKPCNYNDPDSHDVAEWRE